MGRKVNVILIIMLIAITCLVTGCKNKTVNQENPLVVTTISQNLIGDIVFKLKNSNVVIADEEDFGDIMEYKVNDGEWTKASRYVYYDQFLIMGYYSEEAKGLIGETLEIDLRLGAYTLKKTDYLPSPGLSKKISFKFKECNTKLWYNQPVFTGIYDNELLNLFKTQQTGEIDDENLMLFQYFTYGDDQQISGEKYYDYIYMQIDDKIVFKKLDVKEEFEKRTYTLTTIKENEYKMAQYILGDDKASGFEQFGNLEWYAIPPTGININLFKDFPSGNEGEDLDQIFSFYLVKTATDTMTDSIIDECYRFYF